MAAKGESEHDGDAKEEGRMQEPNMAPRAKKQPPPETPEAVRLRTMVILSFWAVIVFLGLPVWWQTTSIYRARLPIQEMLDWSEGTVWAICFPHIVPWLTVL